MYELVAFACISSNIQAYASVRAKYEKCWDFTKILALIESKNSNFLPISVECSGPQDDWRKVRPINAAKSNSKLNLKTLKENMGRLDPLLHARNPYASVIDYHSFAGWLCERKDELMAVLENHVISTGEDRYYFLVGMNGGTDGAVEVSGVMSLDVDTTQ
jgi:hypothetical protein